MINEMVYPNSYYAGDLFYVLGIGLAVSMIIPGLIYRDDNPVEFIGNLPIGVLALAVFGALYAFVGEFMLVGLVIVSQKYGHHGQWIAILVLNIAGWFYFMSSLISSRKICRI